MQFESGGCAIEARSDVEFHLPTLIGNRFMYILRADLMRHDDNVISINDARVEFKLFGK